MKKAGLEFHVSDGGGDRGHGTTVFQDFDKAAGFALSRACSHGGAMQIDVVTWSKAAARAWGGDAAVEIYEEDPDASVHERIIIKAEAIGRLA
jgi:hypothetical protein